jgi:hypothetical protein
VSQIGEQVWRFISFARFFVDKRADWHRQLEIASSVTGTIGSLAVLSPFRVELGMKPVVDQGVRVRARDDVDGAAVASVTAAWAAARDTDFAAECEASSPACASRDVNVYFVNEHRIWSSHHRLIRSFLQIE